MNADLKGMPLSELHAQFDALKAEIERREEATRKATWARAKAKECLERAHVIGRQPTLGRSGRQASNDRAANYARAEARDWEAKARRFDIEAGNAPPEHQPPF